MVVDEGDTDADDDGDEEDEDDGMFCRRSTAVAFLADVCESQVAPCAPRVSSRDGASRVGGQEGEKKQKKRRGHTECMIEVMHPAATEGGNYGKG